MNAESFLTVCAPIRDGSLYLEKFKSQCLALQHDRLRFVFVEGDSKDGTWQFLHEWALEDGRVTLCKHDTGQPKYGSIVHAQRFKNLAQVFNAALDIVDLSWSSHVLFTPSDILFGPDVVSRLLAHRVAFVAPFYYEQGDTFYDTWGFTLRGKPFPKFRKRQADSLFGNSLLEMDTVGGMVLMESHLIRSGCRYTEEEVDRGLCKQVASLGYKIYADPTTHIQHR